MKLLVDVNFDARRADMLRAQGIAAIHWSAVGDSDELDAEILAWARTHGYAVVTQDLGIASALARTDAAGPSVILLRHADDLNPLLAHRDGASFRVFLRASR